jgi:hypothetical protein
MIDRIVRGQPDLETMIDAATQRPAHVHIGDVTNGDIRPRPRGNGREAALRRLRTQRPDLHAEVIAGRLTTNAACVIAGWRHPTLTIRLDDPTSADSVNQFAVCVSDIPKLRARAREVK